jgi:hypothetical protein
MQRRKLASVAVPRLRQIQAVVDRHFRKEAQPV